MIMGAALAPPLGTAVGGSSLATTTALVPQQQKDSRSSQVPPPLRCPPTMRRQLFSFTAEGMCVTSLLALDPT